MNKLQWNILIGMTVIAFGGGLWYWTSSGSRGNHLQTDFSGQLPFPGKSVARSRSGTVWQADNRYLQRVVAIGAQPEHLRMQSLKKVSRELSEHDINIALDYIRNGENSDAEYVIKNNLMNVLRQQKKTVSHLNAALIALVRDREQDQVVRVYALQHLRPQYDETRAPEIRQLFYDALSETDTGISGGALLALRYLLTEYPDDFDRDLLVRRAGEIATSQTTGLLTRISALQVASMLGNDSITDLLRQIVKDQQEHRSLRLAAIAGLGEVGSMADLSLLESLSTGRGIESQAAAVAIRKLQKKTL